MAESPNGKVYMKRSNYFIFLFLSGLMISCQSPDGQKELGKDHQLVSPKEMKELKAMDEVQFIDVRTVKEFREEHIKGAQNLVYDADFKDKIQELDKSQPVAVYCRTGRRSHKCSKMLHEAGFTKIYELKGGITKWKHKDFSIVE